MNEDDLKKVHDIVNLIILRDEEIQKNKQVLSDLMEVKKKLDEPKRINTSIVIMNCLLFAIGLTIILLYMIFWYI